MPPPKTGKYKPSILTLAEAIKEAEKSEKVVLLVVTDKGKPTEDLTKALYSDKLKKLHERFVFAELAFDKDDETCKKLKLDKGPALIALDPRKEKVEESALESYSGKPNQGELTTFLKKWEKGPDKTK